MSSRTVQLALPPSGGSDSKKVVESELAAARTALPQLQRNNTSSSLHKIVERWVGVLAECGGQCMTVVLMVLL